MEWISVKDRFPKTPIDVLVFNGDTQVGYFHKGFWRDFHGERNIKNVTHWMPLPEPPKE
jgi:hypothetical protein